MGFRLVTELNYSERHLWSEFAIKHPGGSVFQSPEFLELFGKETQTGSAFVGVIDENGMARGALFAIILYVPSWPKKHLSSRTLIYGGPIFDTESTNSEEILGLLLEGLVKIVKKDSVYTEFRNFTNFSRFNAVFARHGFQYREHLNLCIDTTTSETVQAGISKSKFRQVKKSLDCGAVVSLAKSVADFEDFYTLLAETYTVRVRKPLPPKVLFRIFFEETLKGKLGLILIVKYKGKLVAGMACLITPGKALHEWYVCGADRDYKEIYPSVLVTWAGINYAVQNGIHCFDFMGIGQPNKDYGVRNFKLRFGGKKVNYGRYIRVNKKIAYSVAKAGLYILTLKNKKAKLNID